MPHNITRLVAESSALKKVFERLLTKKREARLAAEAAEAAGAGARPRTGRARKQKQRLAAQQDCDTTFQVRSVIIIVMLLISSSYRRPRSGPSARRWWRRCAGT